MCARMFVGVLLLLLAACASSSSPAQSPDSSIPLDTARITMAGTGIGPGSAVAQSFRIHITASEDLSRGVAIEWPGARYVICPGTTDAIYSFDLFFDVNCEEHAGQTTRTIRLSTDPAAVSVTAATAVSGNADFQLDRLPPSVLPLHSAIRIGTAGGQAINLTVCPDNMPTGLAGR